MYGCVYLQPVDPVDEFDHLLLRYVSIPVDINHFKCPLELGVNVSSRGY